VTIPEKPYFTYREFRSRVLGSSKSEMCNPIGYKPVTDLERNQRKCLESYELAKPLTLAERGSQGTGLGLLYNHSVGAVHRIAAQDRANGR